MPLSPRTDLDSLPAYVPGRSVPGAIKLASNEMSFGPLPGVREAVVEAVGTINRYPDMSGFALVERLSRKYDVATDQVAVGCGSVSLCQQLVRAFCAEGDEVVFAWRSFEAYPILTQVAGARPIKVPLDEHYRHDLDAMLDEITPLTRVVFICNPNNPTGTPVRRDALIRFLDAVPDSVLVVIDEAYIEFVTDPDVPHGLEFVGERENVAVLRTFSKAYGLAALRVGYLIASGMVADAVRKVTVPFSLNSFGQAAAIASLAAEQELLARIVEVVAERNRVRDGLLAEGYEVPASQANFLWLPLGRRTADFAEHALEWKVVVRPFIGDGVRVTIGTASENDRLLEAARCFPR